MVICCMFHGQHVNLAWHLAAQLQRRANSDRGIVITGLCTPLIEFANPKLEFGEPMASADITVRQLANKHFIKTAKPPYWWKLMGDYPFPLPNVEWISSGDPNKRTILRLDTSEHTQARRVAERRYGAQAMDGNDNPDPPPDEEENEEISDQQPHRPPPFVGPALNKASPPVGAVPVPP